MDLKKVFIATALTVPMALSSCGNPATQNEAELTPFISTDYNAVIEMIDKISVADLTTEKFAEDAYIAYCTLDDSVKDKVSNIDKLQEYRNEITKLYHTEEKRGDRIDRSKLLISTYYFGQELWNDEDVKKLKDCGIDFVIGANYDTQLLDLFEKHGIGAFISYLPSWFGQEATHGQLVEKIPAGSFVPYAEKFVDHPAIWALDICDELGSLDIPHLNVLLKEAEELFPGKLVYINLYPNYGASWRLLNKPYQEHLNYYVEQVETDYISYDHYFYWHFDSDADAYFVDNLKAAQNAAKKDGRDMWIVLQANTVQQDKVSDKKLSTEQLRYQAYGSLAFGVQELSWACWTPGWWKNNVYENGQYTEQYDKLKTVNTELKNLSPIYMRYKCLDTEFISTTLSATVELTKQKIDYLFKKQSDGVLEQSTLIDIKAEKNSSILLGSFEKRAGNGTAFMFTNVTDFHCTEESQTMDSWVKFKVKDKNVQLTAYTHNDAYVLSPDANGEYEIYIPNGEGIFVTVDNIETTAE
ncbi:MAG: hypothetical protein E7481_10065 [Ruminococcaceae bacterium]|nr:hypothetical protein [Oscillospiraceae bacterium]